MIITSKLILIIVTLSTTLAHVCYADIGDEIKPLQKPIISKAKIAMKNLEAYSKTVNGKKRAEVVNLAKSIKELFTAEYRVSKALESQIESEKKARGYEKTARDWMEPTALQPNGRPEHARASILKAERTRKSAVENIAKSKEVLRNEMRKMNAIIVSFYESNRPKPTVILAGVANAINERSLPKNPFPLKISESAIDNLKLFVANVDRWLKDAKDAEDVGNYEKAFRLYTKAKDVESRRRCSLFLAKNLEGQGLYGSAIDYYETGADFDNSKRLRKAHPELLQGNFAKLDAEDLYAKSAPSCVYITAIKKTGVFTGSGFVFKRGGYILTNNHVIEGATEIEVETVLGKKYRAKVLAKSKTPDLAVIQIELKNHDIIKLGDAGQVKVGTPVALIGFPKGVLHTATMNVGIVSNVNVAYGNNPCFQLDVSANHGNSGGPVLMQTGQVIGILTFGLADSGVDRFNFAIRVDEIRKFLLQKMGKDFAE